VKSLTWRLFYLQIFCLRQEKEGLEDALHGDGNGNESEKSQFERVRNVFT